MRTSEKTGAIAAALYAVHRDLDNPRKDAKGQVRGNPNYRYLSLPALIDHIKEQLRAAQVAVIQDVTGGDGYIGVTTVLMHLTGEFVEVGPLLLPATTDAQGAGSAITYARRYALAAALNLAADEDDDGVKASRRSSGESTANANTGPGSVRSPSRDAVSAQVASVPAGSLEADGAASPPLSVLSGGGSTDVAAPDEGDDRVGEGRTAPPGAASTYLTKEEQKELILDYGSSKVAVEEFKKRFGSRIQRMADITCEMVEAMDS